MPRDDGPTVDAGRRAAAENAGRLTASAVRIYEDGDFPLECFLAMTAIEECGKVQIIGTPRRAAEQVGPPVPYVVTNRKQFNDQMRDHTGKSLTAALYGFLINAGADRRQGTHTKTGIHRTTGVFGLAAAGIWMRQRNACLYVDVGLPRQTVQTPTDEVDERTANYFIRMAYESVAEIGWIGFGNGSVASHDKASRWQESHLAVLDGFMNRQRRRRWCVVSS